MSNELRIGGKVIGRIKSLSIDLGPPRQAEGLNAHWSTRPDGSNSLGIFAASPPEKLTIGKAKRKPKPVPKSRVAPFVGIGKRIRKAKA